MKPSRAREDEPSLPSPNREKGCGSPKSVLFVLPSLRGGGAERVIVTLLNHLDRSRVRPRLAVLTTEGAVYREDLPNDIELIDLECSRVRFAVPKLVKLIWSLRPDVVFSTLGHLNLAIGAVRLGLPPEITYLARETTVVTESLDERRDPAWVRLAYRVFYRGFDKIVCQSEAMRADLVDSFAIPAERLVTIHNPVDIQRVVECAQRSVAHGFGEGDVTDIVACGRLEHEKGFDIAIKALAAVREPRLRLTVLGEGSLRESLQALAAAEGVGEQVRWVGRQSNPFGYFAGAKAFLHSSRYEGFPNAVLEALACGTPIIATPALGDLTRTVKALPGCVIANEASADALARAMRAWLAGPRVRFDGAAAVEPYCADSIARKYEAVLAGQDRAS